MSIEWCTLHEADADEHWTTDVVGVIPALRHLDGTWEPIAGIDTFPQDRECAKANGIEPDRIVVWPVAS